jgi:hypothetical protein
MKKLIGLAKHIAFWAVMVVALVVVIVVAAFKVGGYNLNIETEAQTHERVMNAGRQAEADYLLMLQDNMN